MIRLKSNLETLRQSLQLIGHRAEHFFAQTPVRLEHPECGQHSSPTDQPHGNRMWIPADARPAVANPIPQNLRPIRWCEFGKPKVLMLMKVIGEQRPACRCLPVDSFDECIGNAEQLDSCSALRLHMARWREKWRFRTCDGQRWGLPRGVSGSSQSE